MPGYFELKTASSGKPHFTLKAANHEVILSSEIYESKAAALAGIESVRSNGGDPASFEKKTSTAGQPYFVLKATNGQVIGSSQMYASDAARDIGIVSVMTNAPTAEVREI